MNETAINLNEYFDFLDQDDIRIKGTRVGIETVLEDCLNAASPEEIAMSLKNGVLRVTKVEAATRGFRRILEKCCTKKMSVIG